MAVKHFEFTFETQGYVHIGNGNSLNKKNYFISDGLINILDCPKFVALLSEEQLGRYLDFLTEDHRSSFDFFLSHNKDIQRLVNESVRYSLKTNLDRRKSGGELRHGIAEFVKDAYGCPFIPGSSVKGVLRSAIIMHQVLQDQVNFRELYDMNRMALRGGKKSERGAASRKVLGKVTWLERISSGERFVDRDIMRFISVADSMPLNIEDLCLAKKYDQFSLSDAADHKRMPATRGAGVNNAAAKGNELNIYRECLRPGVKFTIRVDVDECIADYLGVAEISGATLASLFIQVNERYQNDFLSHFELNVHGEQKYQSSNGGCNYIYKEGIFAGQRCRNAAVNGTPFCGRHQGEEAASSDSETSVVCYLGGGVGYPSKTATNALFDDDVVRVDEVARILYAQFPSEFAQGCYSDTKEEVREAGFLSKSMKPRGRSQKNDPRHWKSGEFGVAPHTLKLGKCMNDMREMGKCSLAVKELK
jgi:CRISPR/Cas system CSM-associated protein Csm5 (group 7 of RAMP superfamily)